MRMINYATLAEWLDRDKGLVHGDIMANIDTLIKMALKQEDAENRVRHLERRIDNLMRSIKAQQDDIHELKNKACRIWTCEKRRV